MKTKNILPVAISIFLSLLFVNPAISDDPSGGHLASFASSGPGMINLALDASSFTGEATTSVPLELLPCAGDIQEKIKLELQYRSGGGNSWAGKGWELELGYIAKTNKFGYNNANNPYSLSLNGQTQELVSIGGDQYRTKIESNMRIQFNGSMWWVWDKDGTEYRFDISAAGKWVLTRITQTHGISLVIEYDRVSSEEIYPVAIRYPVGSTLSSYCNVGFISEERPDKFISYCYGSRWNINRRLKAIQIWAEGSQQRGYSLYYTNNGTSQISLLSSVVESGKNGLTMPAIGFNYISPMKQNLLGQDQTWQPPTDNLFTQHNGHDFQDLGATESKVPQSFDISVLDMTGDGIPDFIGCKFEQGYSRGSNAEPPSVAYKSTWLLYRGTKNGFSSSPEVWVNPEDSYFTDHVGKVESISLGWNATLADMNADGLPDLAYSKYTGTTVVTYVNHYPVYDIKVRLNNGNGFGAETTWLPSSEAYYIYNMSADIAVRLRLGRTANLVDMNGDGRADLLFYRYGGNIVYGGAQRALFGWNVRLNNGSGFSSEETTWLTYDKAYFTYSWPTETGGELYYCGFEHIRLGSNATLVDMNNDGLPDLVFNDYADKFQYVKFACISAPSYKAIYNWKVRYNTGNGFSEEFMLYPSAPVYIYQVFLANCGGPFEVPQYNAVSTRIGENGTITDLNNDNLPDLVFNRYTDGPYVYLTYFPTTDWMVAYNLGDHFDTSIITLMPSLDHIYDDVIDTIDLYANVVTSNSVFADLDMDGKVDFIYPYLIQKKSMAGSGFTATFDWRAKKNVNNYAADLLIEQTGAFGGKTNIAYETSSSFSNYNLPFVMPVVKSITKNPGVGDAGTTTYNYEGGWHDLANREFRGFRHVQTTDPLGFTTHTYFHQDDPRLGKVEKQENPVTRALNTYLTDNSAPYFTPLIQLDEYADSKCSRLTYDYDGYGNVIKTVYYGDTDVTGDEKSIVTDYALNTSSWLLNLPSRERIFANTSGTGTPVSETQYFYDNNSNYTDTPSKGDVTKIRRYLDTKFDYIQATSTYDSYGNELTKTDAKGNTTTIEYDSTYHAFPITVTNAKNQIERTSYYMPLDTKGLFGQIKERSDPNDNQTSFEYDGLGRKTKVTGPYDLYSTYGSESYEYGINGPSSNYILTRTTEENGTSNYRSKTDILDGFERVVQISKESEDQGICSYVTTKYNSRGEIDKITLPYFKDGGMRTSYLEPDGSAKWTQNSYDAIGRITKITKPDSNSIINTHNGWITIVLDENSHSKTLTKDAYGQLVNVIEKNGAEEYSTNYKYDTLGNLTLITDHSGNNFEFFYDSLKRRTKMIDPDLGTWNYNYDDNGNFIKTQNSNNQVINYGYDELNRITSKDYASQTGVEATYRYDEASSTNGIGRRTSMQDLSGNSAWYYDKEGRITKLEKNIDTATYTVEWAYDAMDRVKSIIFPNLKTINFIYNKAGLVETIDGYVLAADYNASSQPTKVIFSNPMITMYDYYPDTMRLKSILTNSLQDLLYEYDKVGNITKITDNKRSNVKDYVYDGLDRLLSGDGNTYEYNAIGNIAKVNGTAQSYLPARPHALINDGTNSYSYDSCGNMTAGAGRAIGYDPENRPVNIAKSGVTTQFSYDGDGKRVKKTVTDGSSVTTTIYIEDLYEKESSK